MTTLPEEMWFGTIDGQWPVQCWESETHAMGWLANSKPTDRARLWRAKLVDPVEFEAVTPKPYLQAKGGDS